MIPISLRQINVDQRVPEWLFRLKDRQNIEKCIAGIRANPKKYPDTSVYEQYLESWPAANSIENFDGPLASEKRWDPDLCVGAFKNKIFGWDNHTELGTKSEHSTPMFNVFYAGDRPYYLGNQVDRQPYYLGNQKDPYGRSALDYLLDGPCPLRCIVNVAFSLGEKHDEMPTVKTLVCKFLEKRFHETGITEESTRTFAVKFWEHIGALKTTGNYTNHLELIRLAASENSSQRVSGIYEAFGHYAAGTQSAPLSEFLSNLALQGNKRDFLENLYAHLLFGAKGKQDSEFSLISCDLDKLEEVACKDEWSAASAAKAYAFRLLARKNFACGMDVIVAKAFAGKHHHVALALAKLHTSFVHDNGRWPHYKVSGQKMAARFVKKELLRYEKIRINDNIRNEDYERHFEYIKENGYEANRHFDPIMQYPEKKREGRERGFSGLYYLLKFMRALKVKMCDFDDGCLSIIKRILEERDVEAFKMLMTLGLNKNENDHQIRVVNEFVKTQVYAMLDGFPTTGRLYPYDHAMLKFLHEEGFSFNGKDSKGYYPLDYTSSCDQNMIEKLKEYGSTRRGKWPWQSAEEGM